MTKKYFKVVNKLNGDLIQTFDNVSNARKLRDKINKKARPERDIVKILTDWKRILL